MKLLGSLAALAALAACKDGSLANSTEAQPCGSIETREMQISDSAPEFLRGEGKLYGTGLEEPFGDRQHDGSRAARKTGWWVTFYYDGSREVARESAGEFREGRREGSWRFWHRDGSLRASGSFSGGCMTGRWDCRREYGAVDREHSGMYEDGQRVPNQG
jgi:hypothetical protein